MARLVPNPIGDLIPTLERVEQAIKDIPEELTDVRRLPAIHEELVTLNEKMSLMLDALHGVSQQLAERDSAGAAV